MEIVFDNPPNIKAIQQVLEIGDAKMIFCYGNVIYNPYKLEIADHLKIHELVHSGQQGNNPEKWWERYLKDSEFRLNQELEAYQRQYDFAKQWIKDRNVLARFLYQIANDLSSLYKVNISLGEAQKQIKC